MICTVKVLTTCGSFDFDIPEDEFLVRVCEYLDNALADNSEHPVLEFGAFPEVWKCRASVIRGYTIRRRAETKVQQQWSKLVEAMTTEMQSGNEWNQ